ncbi:kallikrein-2-like [Maniola jurtina]|uniref:kallikrein-2-like n=1 Tax=Maniola jurtina TaxID=191418 RepID=UPI001E68CC72|nr:kallikrein-2-like [Maniola jurtina]
MCLLFVLLVSYYFTTQCETSLRIYGGRDAARGEFPYVVRIEEHTTLFFNGKTEREIWNRCTGAALTSSWILSAAHCVEEDDFNNKNKKLAARYNSYFPKYPGKTSTIFEAKIHPTYTSYLGYVEDHNIDNELKNDLCLFRSEGIVVNHYGKLSPVDYRTLIGHEAYTLGFGGTNASEYRKPLQVLKGMLYECNKEYTDSIYELCLMPQCGIQTTICGGDSGGPVVHPSGIVGVNSDSVGDCDEYSTSLNVPAGTAADILATCGNQPRRKKEKVSKLLGESERFAQLWESHRLFLYILNVVQIAV